MSCQRSGLRQPHTVLATLATLPFLFAAQAWAAPHYPIVRRDSSTGGGGSKVVAPIIAALVFLVGIPMVLFRSKLLSKLRHVSLTLNPMRRRMATTTTVRDLTAEEIAGTAATNQANTAAATRTERRARRTRRTPSQISTRSLPAYMKEPGEHELVIIQGSQDMEDAPLTAQVVMPSVEEDEDESSNSHSRNTSQVSTYVIVDDDPHVHTPLLQTNESDETTPEHENSNPPIPYRTVDIAELRYNDPSSPPSNNFGFADPRGEAPPYFEVVGNPSDARDASGDLARVDTTDTLPIAPDTFPVSIGATPPGPRRSMFRGLIDAASRALSSPHPSAQPVPLSQPSRDMAMTPSPRPSNVSNRPSGTPSPHVGHRPTQSSSGSIFSVTSSAFRTRSRSVTNVAGGLTSPSAISITSISAPLTHTALRTDFVYPRSGPTPEQLKLISSVESVSKFGVPYGPDAVAFASVSLVNLQGPPPEFEERPSSDNLPGPSTPATRVRPTSGLSRLSQDGNVPGSWPSIPSPQIASMGTPVASANNESEATVPPPEPDANSHAPILSDAASASEIEVSEDKKEQQEEDRPVETDPPRAASPPKVDTTTTTAIVTAATASGLSPVPESPDNGAAPVSHRPVLPFFSSESMTATATTRAPSSFRMPSTPLGHVHTASRSSSIDTFLTAVSRHEQGRGSERETSDTEHDADSFSDAGSGAETGSGSPPHVASVRGTVLSPEPPALSV